MLEFKGDKRTREYKEWKANQSKGLGDVIEKVTEATGIKKAVELFSKVTGIDCGCAERKEKLNNIFRRKTECLNEVEYNYLKEFFSLRRNTVSANVQKELLKINNRVFKVNAVGSSCDSCVREMVGRLKKVYLAYDDKQKE